MISLVTEEKKEIKINSHNNSSLAGRWTRGHGLNEVNFQVEWKENKDRKQEVQS